MLLATVPVPVPVPVLVPVPVATDALSFAVFGFMEFNLLCSTLAVYKIHSSLDCFDDRTIVLVLVERLEY